MITVSYDREEDLVMVRFAGFLTIPEAKKFNFDLRTAVTQARRQKGRARLLVYASNLVQSAETMQQLGTARDLLDPERDKVAIMAETSLIKVQVQRGLEGNQKAFLSENAARTWLALEQP